MQSLRFHEIVKDKTQKAFSEIGRPVFVELTGLYINSLNKFPGGLAELFWKKLEADKFTELLGGFEDTSLTATTVIGYCDGKRIYLFEDSVDGNISLLPKGDRTYDWDCVFISCSTVVGSFFLFFFKISNKINRSMVPDAQTCRHTT